MKTKLLAGLLFFSGFITFAQQTITGTVTAAEDGLPLSGANVIVKGTTQGTTADFDGNYTITADQGAILVYSYLGFISQEVTVGSNTTIDVALEGDAETLGEVTVIGYGAAESKDLAGSISSLDSEEVNASPTTSVLQAAQGKLAGIQVINDGAPGSVGQVRIRGSISVLGGSEPLYVVDGVITQDISGIDNSDIKSMDILKDASSTAIYGARGANGVVLITTKSGRGEGKISLSTQTGFNTMTNAVEMANAQQYAQYTNEALIRSGNEPAFTSAQIANLQTTNWFDEITRSGLYQKYNAAISGGSENTDYYFSANYLDEEGILKNNKYERLAVRLNNTYRTKDWLRFGHNISLVRGRGFNATLNDAGVNPSFQTFTTAYKQAPHIPVRDGDGNYFETNLNNVGNPVASIENNSNVSQTVTILGNIWGEIDFAEWLTFRSSIGANVFRQKVRDYGARYMAVNETDTQIRNENQILTVSDNDSERFNWDNFFTIDKQFGKHDFNLTLGLTSERFTSEFFNANRRGVPNADNLLYLDIGETEGQDINNGGDKATRTAYFGRLLYDFDNRYVFNATLRREGSSKFAESQRIEYYPSFGVAWNVDNESFLADQDGLSTLKLRASYGQIGNDRIDSSQFLRLVDFGGYPFPGGVVVTATSTQQFDENLRWETTTELDLGLDFGFLSDRLTGSFTYYSKDTEDILFPLAIPQTIGDDSFITNAGNIENKGFEASVNWSDATADNDFSYTFGFNITANRNELTQINPILEGEDSAPFIQGGSLGNGQIVTRTEEGYELGTFWLYKTDGVFQSQEEIDNSAQPNAKIGDFRYVDTDNDGAITQEDRQFMGSYQPDFYYGINLGVRYKSVDFSTNMFGNVGGKVFNGNRAQRFGGENIDADVFNNRWTASNGTNEFPGASNDIPLPSDYFLEDGDFLRVNNITLGYTFSDKVTDVLKIDKLRIYASAQNALTFTDYSGFNPELPRGILDSGLEIGAYPTSAKYLVGVNLDF